MIKAPERWGRYPNSVGLFLKSCPPAELLSASSDGAKIKTGIRKKTKERFRNKKKLKVKNRKSK